MLRNFMAASLLAFTAPGVATAQATDPGILTIVCRDVEKLTPQGRFGTPNSRTRETVIFRLNLANGTGTYPGFSIQPSQPAQLRVSEGAYELNRLEETPYMGDTIIREYIVINRFSGELTHHMILLKGGRSFWALMGGRCAATERLF